jgi:hypothetical protein
VEIYENENDQVDAIKRFFAENGKALAVGVILGVVRWLAGVTGTIIRRIPRAARLWPMKIP